MAEQRRVTEPPRALLSGSQALTRVSGVPGVLQRRPWLLVVVSRPLVRFEMVGKRLSAAASGRLLVLHQSCQLFDGSRGDGDMHAALRCEHWSDLGEFELGRCGAVKQR